MSPGFNIEELRESVRATERKYLNELEVPTGTGWVDVHTHVLPGVDDGAETMARSLELLHEAWEGGTRELVATPHMFRSPFDNFEPELIVSKFSDFVRELRELGLNHGSEYSYLRDLTIHLGAENYVSPEFLTALAERRVLTLGATQCVLIEFPETLASAAAESAVHKVLEAGYIPVLAHVERVSAFTKSPATLEALVETGAVAQVNLRSMIEPRFREIACGHVQSARARLVASDGHDLVHRSLRLDRLSRLSGPRRLRTLVEEAMTVQPRRLFDKNQAA